MNGRQRTMRGVVGGGGGARRAATKLNEWLHDRLWNCRTVELPNWLSRCLSLSPPLSLSLSANVYYEKRALLNGIVYFGFYLFLFYFFYFMIFVRARALMWVLFSLSFPRCICIFLSRGRAVQGQRVGGRGPHNECCSNGGGSGT